MKCILHPFTIPVVLVKLYANLYMVKLYINKFVKTKTKQKTINYII